ncbi:MAG: hypothetical protein ACODAE_09055 [Gemmatimonadota bacterium]
MRFELLEGSATVQTASTIRRLMADGTQWRVRVETWHDGECWRGRLLFDPDQPVRDDLGVRFGPPTLRGRTREEVVASAHEVPERRLRVVLRSLL